MADSRPPTPRPDSSFPAAKYAPRPVKETVDERRARQSAAALAAQLDLKREAAERRARKSSS
jgi:hypothetical protein